MFANIFSEIKKIVDNFALISREERDARNEKRGGEPIFRMVEAERVHTNFLSVIPASVILFLVEACGMVWSILNKIKFGYSKGFLISFLVFVVLSALYFVIIEAKLRDPDFSLKQKRIIYITYWLIYSIEAMSFSIMELLDRGTVNNFLCFVFVFTVLPVISPTRKTIALMLTFLVEAGVMYAAEVNDPDIILLCFVAVLIASVVSYTAFFRYMNMKITEKRLEHFANGDQLTMLTNRRGFASLAPELKKHCEKNSYKLLVVMADIDNFKKYNDTYGHVEGDICLKNVASVIRENFSRPSDICARYGGEEFIIMSAINDESRMLDHIKALLTDVSKISGKKDERVTLSLGVCISETPSRVQLNDLIKIADSELYNAKTNGKNCLSYKGKIYRVND